MWRCETAGGVGAAAVAGDSCCEAAPCASSSEAALGDAAAVEVESRDDDIVGREGDVARVDDV